MNVFEFLAVLQQAIDLGYFTRLVEGGNATRVRLQLTQWGEEAFEDAQVSLASLACMTTLPARWQFCPVTAVALMQGKRIFPTGNPYDANNIPGMGLDEELLSAIIVAADADHLEGLLDPRAETLMAAVTPDHSRFLPYEEREV